MGASKAITSLLFLVFILHQSVGQTSEESKTCVVAAYNPGAGFFRQVSNNTIIPPDKGAFIYPVCCLGLVFNETTTGRLPVCDSECPSGSCVYGYCPPDDEKVNCQCYDDNFYPRDNDIDCIPVCSPSEEGECTCHAGYTKDETTNLCVPTECHDRCTNGHCDQIGTCTCDEGFVKHTNKTGLCVPHSCDLNCYHGTCSTNGSCTCDKGFQNINVETCEDVLICPPLPGHQEDVKMCKEICDSQCIHGNCTEDGACICNAGFKNNPEGSLNCESECEAKCITGKCDKDGSCNCVSGYKKSADDSFTCNKISCPSDDTEDSEYCKEKCESICLTGSCSDEGRCTCATPTPTELPEQQQQD